MTCPRHLPTPRRVTCCAPCAAWHLRLPGRRSRAAAPRSTAHSRSTPPRYSGDPVAFFRQAGPPRRPVDAPRELTSPRVAANRWWNAPWLAHLVPRRWVLLPWHAAGRFLSSPLGVSFQAQFGWLISFHALVQTERQTREEFARTRKPVSQQRGTNRIICARYVCPTRLLTHTAIATTAPGRFLPRRWALLPWHAAERFLTSPPGVPFHAAGRFFLGTPLSR